jgi:regulatory protein
VSEIEETLQQLASLNLQSDDRFAEAYVTMRKNRHYGPVRIRGELLERGVDEAVFSKWLNESSEEWVNLAQVAREKKFGASVPHDFNEIAKQKHFLHYRGFTSRDIKAAFKQS